MSTSVHLTNGDTPLPTITADWNTDAEAGLVVLDLSGGKYARTDLRVALAKHDAMRLLDALNDLLYPARPHLLVGYPPSTVSAGFVGWQCSCGDQLFSYSTKDGAAEGHAQHARESIAVERAEAAKS